MSVQHVLQSVDALLASHEDEPVTETDEHLKSYLAPRGKAPGIGRETDVHVRYDIVRYTSPHGSVRYVMYRETEPVAVLQVVRTASRHAIVANVYTTPGLRRQGLARDLFRQAQQDFDVIRHSRHLSGSGQAWARAVG